MTKLSTRLFGAAVLMMLAGTAFAAQYPPGPGATCPDSVTVMRIQNSLATCHPAIGDTVYGVGGIITGFDAIPTGFGFYIENSDGEVFSGIDVFTHGTNYQPVMGLQEGDSIVVESSKVGQFQNGLEIFGTNNLFSAPNIILRKVSSGNALPPFFLGTTTQLKELPTNTFGRQYEGMLVRINGPLTVARTSLTGGLGTFNSFLVVDPTAPGDSVFVDGSTLTSYNPPPVGKTVTIVQGIYDLRTRGFRIQLRDGNDILCNTPPGVSDAYPIAENQVRVVFDRNVTPATATDTTNYALASLGAVHSAVMDGSTAAILTIDNGLSHGQLETVTVSNIASSANGLVMDTPQSETFFNGVVSCAEVQAPNPDSLAATPCIDKSIYAGANGQTNQGLVGNRMAFTGICMGQFGNLFYMEDMDANGQVPYRGALTLFAPPVPLTVGHRYLVTGGTQEFFGETEFSSVAKVYDQGIVGPVGTQSPQQRGPDPVDLSVSVARLDTCDAAQTINSGNDYESFLVRLDNVKVVARGAAAPSNPVGFYVAGPNPTFTDTIAVQDMNNVIDNAGPNPAVGTVLDVTGVMHYSFGVTGPKAVGVWRVCPRSKSDLVVKGLNTGVPGSGPVLSFAVYPNPARTTNVTFTLPKDTQVQVGVYDLLGRRIVEFANGLLPAGNYSYKWSGRDASGHSVGAGVYFYRLKAGNDVRLVRAVMLGN